MGMKGLATGMLVFARRMRDCGRSCAMDLGHMLHCMRSEHSESSRHCFLLSTGEGLAA